MASLVLNFDKFVFKPYIKLDGKEIRFYSFYKNKQCCLTLEPGIHEVVICEKRSIHKWYWWLQIFNLYYVFSMLKGLKGTQLGFDGDCVFASFRLMCCEEKKTVVKITRQEVCWESSDVNADYNMVYIKTNVEMVLTSYSISKKERFRLKFGAVSSLCFITVCFSIIVIIFSMQKKMSIWELFLNWGVEVYLIGLTSYKLYKTAKQKSFTQLCDISRITIRK